MYQPKPDDLSADMLTPMVGKLMDVGTEVHVKWTCPSCGERVMADNPLELLPPTPERRMKGVGWAPHYLHSVKADGTPCMISAMTMDWRFGIVTIDRMDDTVIVVDYDNE